MKENIYEVVRRLCVIFFLLILIIVLQTFLIWIAKDVLVPTSNNIRQVEKEKDSYADDSITEYIDTETGVHYLLHVDTGGITPRYNHDGSIMTDDNKNE